MPETEKLHSPIGASSATRWFACPGSVGLIDLAPPQVDTSYAAQGTAAHWVALDEILKQETPLPADHYVGRAAPNGYEIVQEDADAVQTFVDFVQAERKTGKFILYTEVGFDLGVIHPGLFGTADAVLLESNMRRLKVIDYKHGAGIPVEVENNKQLMYYALGAVQKLCLEHKFDHSFFGWGQTFREVEVIVVQPRCRHKSGVIRRWVVPAATLDKFAQDLAANAKAAMQKNATLKAGTHCRFCPAIGICPEVNKQTMALAQVDFKAVSHPSNLNLPSPDQLSNNDLRKIMDFADIISEFLKRVESHAQNLMEHGEEIAGYKLVRKKANRQWKDEDEAKETLTLYVTEEDMYEKKFLSPAKAEKILGKVQKKIVEDLCFKPETGNTLAPEHDPREAVPGSALTDFANID